MNPESTNRSVDVLVVDDDEAVRSSLADVLRVSGFSVEVAEDGDVALTLLGQLEARLVLLDLRMPRCGGIAVLEALDNPPPIVLMSAFVLGEEERSRLGGKVKQFLQKPVSPHRLLPIVAGIVWNN